MTRPCCRRSSGTNPTPAAIAAVGDALRSSLPAHRDRARVVPVDAEHGPRHLAAPRADQPGERDDLPGAHGQRDVGEHALAGQPPDRRAPVPGRVRAASAARSASSLPTIARTRSAAVRPASSLVEHVPAVPHHRDPLADREDLLEPVRDEQHRGAARRAARRSPRRAGPVSAADSAAVGSSITITRASRDSALPISTTCWSAMDRPRAIRAGSSGTPSRLKSRGRLVAHRAPVDPAPRPQRLASDEHVLRHGQVGEQRRLLVDDRDARPPWPRPGRAA